MRNRFVDMWGGAEGSCAVALDEGGEVVVGLEGGEGDGAAFEGGGVGFGEVGDCSLVLEED